MRLPRRSMSPAVSLALLLGAGVPALAQSSDPSSSAEPVSAAAPAEARQASPEGSRPVEVATVDRARIGPWPLSGGAEVLVVSAYVWRGFLPADAASYQPTAWLAFGDVTVYSWLNLTGRSYGGLTEHDLTVDYSTTRGAWTLSAGWINYVFPKADVDAVSNEIYGGVSFGGPLSPSLKVYQDVHAGSGTYVSFGVGHAFALANRIEVSPALALGFNHRQWVERSGWSDVNASVKLAVPLARSRLWLTPVVGYSHPFSRQIGPRRLYGGVAMAVR